MKIGSVSSNLSLRLQKAEQIEATAERVQVETVRPAQHRPDPGKGITQSQSDVTVADLQHVIDDTNQMIRYVNERLEFSVHEATNRVMVKVFDRETDEVLREIPPEQMLDLVAKLQELVGILIDKRA